MTPKQNDTPYKIFRIYLKSASVEVPHMDKLAAVAISPQIGVDMNTEANPAWLGALECVLRISLHARVDGMNVFVLEVSVAGVFELPPMQPADVTRFVRQVAPSVLFPFARKDLAALAVSAGFQPILLDHIDFDSLLTAVIHRHKASSTANAGTVTLPGASRPAPLPAPMQMRMDQAPAAAPAPAAPAPEAPPIKLKRNERPEPPGPPKLELPPMPGATPAPAPAAPAPALPPDRPLPPAAERQVPLPEDIGTDTEDEWPNTAPLPEATGIAPPLREPMPSVPGRHRRHLIAAAVAGAAGLVVWGMWPGKAAEEPARLAKPVSSAPTVLASVPASAASAPVAAVSAASAPASPTLQALDQSRQRLADQPADWHSVALGTLDADKPLSTLDHLPLQGPVYVVKLPDQRLQVMYGAFPTPEAAEAARAQTAQWPATGLTGEAKVVSFGK